MTPKHKKILANVIKIAIVVLAFGFIYKKVSHHNDLKAFVDLLAGISVTEKISVLAFVCLLMLVNWTIEAIKWRKIIASVQQLTLWQAIASVFCGLTLAVFTPNRIGEYGGRVFFLSPKRRIIGVVAMAVGSMAQLVLTNVLGIVTAYIFLVRFLQLGNFMTVASGVFCVLYVAFFIIFYFNIKWLNTVLCYFSFTRKYERFYGILARYNKKELLQILLLSIARYVVFTTQYVIMFMWLIPDLSFLDIILLVPILFFVQSALPSLDLLDIGIRSITALFFFKYVTAYSAPVVACIASIWLINIIFPAILGSYFVFKLKIFGNAKHS